MDVDFFFFVAQVLLVSGRSSSKKEPVTAEVGQKVSVATTVDVLML